jgi:hypothetical protein
MTTSLRTVTLKTVANYRHAAERTLGASRRTGERLIAVMRDGVERAARVGAEPYAPALAAALCRAGDNLGNLADQGLAAVSERTSRVIAAGADGVVTQVERVADLVDGVDNKVVATGLQAAVRVSMPGAHVALAVSERVASGADKLADVAGASTATGRAARAAGKRVRRAKADAADVVATATTGARRQVRRGRAAAESVAETVTRAVKSPKVAKAEKAVKSVAKSVKAKAAAPVAAAKPTRTRRAAKPANVVAKAVDAVTEAVSA